MEKKKQIKEIVELADSITISSQEYPIFKITNPIGLVYIIGLEYMVNHLGEWGGLKEPCTIQLAESCEEAGKTFLAYDDTKKSFLYIPGKEPLSQFYENVLLLYIPGKRHLSQFYEDVLEFCPQHYNMVNQHEDAEKTADLKKEIEFFQKLEKEIAGFQLN